MLAPALQLTLALVCYAVIGAGFFTAHANDYNVTSARHLGALFFLSTALVFMYVALRRCLAAISVTDRAIKHRVALGAVAIGVLWFLMPHPYYTLDDTKIYFFHARIFTAYEANPYEVVPGDYASDPDFSEVADWRGQRFNYGPLWLMISSLPARLGVSMPMATFFYRGFAVIAVLVIAWLVYARSSDWRRAVAVVLHPAVLWWAVMGGHNDAIMLGLVALAWFCVERKKYRWFVLLFAAALLIKYTALIFSPAFVFIIFKNEKRLPRALAVSTWTHLLVAALAVMAYAPFTLHASTVLAERTLVNPRLSGPLFSLAYYLGQGSMVYADEFFNRWRTIFMALFLAAAAALMARVALVPGRWTAERLMRYLISMFYAMTFWFQPWYTLWLVPFTLESERLSSLLAWSAVWWYGLIFYLFSYTFTPIVGAVITALLFAPLVFLARWFESKNHTKH